MKSARYQFGEVVVDPRNLRVTTGSGIRPLEPKSFRLLLFLVENPGRALSKEEIMAAVWGDTFVSDNSLARAITQIRKAIDDDPKASRYIETVPSLEEQHFAVILPGYAEFAARVPLLVPRWPSRFGPDRFSFALYRKNREYEALGGWLIGAVWLAVKTVWFV